MKPLFSVFAGCLIRWSMKFLPSPPDNWNPASHVCVVFVIRGSKDLPEMGFLVKDDKQMKTQSKRKTIEEKARRRKEDYPAKEEDEDASIHWVSRVVVEALNDQMFWCIKRRRSALTNGGEIPDTP
jgi:hypothetical protein